MRSASSFVTIFLGTILVGGPLFANDAHRIAAATSPAPKEYRADAAVLGFDANGEMQTLREGSGELICLADDPRDERFHVACYHRSLDPFMARGRELKAEGKKRDEVTEIRRSEIEAGRLDLPREPRSLFHFTGTPDSYDPETGEVSGARHVQVLYIPYATAESTGLTTTPAPLVPWLMAPGEPWAHVMFITPPNSTEHNGEKNGDSETRSEQGNSN